ncbi:MAG: hypothetical protein M3256_15550 [Actinomycetota bacterium]|nr:hypothetical protein [Actinomycetota bacterium]
MNVGLWMAPAVCAGLFSFLWAAAWLERLVAPPGFAHDMRVGEGVALAPTDTRRPPIAHGFDGDLAAGLEELSPTYTGGRPPCTSG